MGSTDDTNHCNADTHRVYQTKRALQTSRPQEVKMIKEPRSQRAKALRQPHYIMRRERNEVLRFHRYESLGNIVFSRRYRQEFYPRIG